MKELKRRYHRKAIDRLAGRMYYAMLKGNEAEAVRLRAQGDYHEFKLRGLV